MLILFLVTPSGSHVDRIFLFNFQTTQCKNHLDTKLVKINKAVIEILSFSRSVLFLVTANGGYIECQIAKNQNGFIQDTF